MSRQDNKDLIRRFHEEIVGTGSEEAKRHILDVRRTYPDLPPEVTLQIAERDLVVSQVTMRGTHKGEWLGIAPTGKPVAATAVNIDRVVGGRILEHGGAANLFEPLLRIGAIRVVGAQTSR